MAERPPILSAARIARLLIESATTLAHSVHAKAIIVAIDGLPEELEGMPPRTVLVVRNEFDRERVEQFADEVPTIEVPNVELDRLGQVKLAGIIALSQQLIQLGDKVVFLTGPFRSMIDSLVVMSLGAEYELFNTTDQPELNEHIRRAVFHRALSLALHLGQHGREGKKVGCLMVIGNSKQVLEQSEQMILNPFKGYSESERNILDDRVTETIKEYSSLDGAFIIRGSGVVETAGARLKASLNETLPPGLGARHAAAAGITANTSSIAITVSESDGTVRVWRAGKMVASLEPTPR